MTPSQKLSRARNCVLTFCQERFPGETIELRDSVFICDEFYRGRRFRCDQISAVWFMEEDQVKIHAPDGTCLATWDANELAERFQDGQAKTLPMPSTRPSVMPQADIRRAA